MWNLGAIPSLTPWDPSLVILAMETIFLRRSSLIYQNQTASEDELWTDLDLQASLLNEHEATQLIAMAEAIAKNWKCRSK